MFKGSLKCFVSYLYVLFVFLCLWCLLLCFCQQGFPDNDWSDVSPLWLKIESPTVLGTYSVRASAAPLWSAVFIQNSWLYFHSQTLSEDFEPNFKKNGLVNTSIHTPLTYNHLFKPAQMDTAFLDWRRRGLCCIGGFYINNKFASFLQLQPKYCLPQKDFYRYLQVRHFIKEYIQEFPGLSPLLHHQWTLHRNWLDEMLLIARMEEVCPNKTNLHFLRIWRPVLASLDDSCVF